QAVRTEVAGLSRSARTTAARSMGRLKSTETVVVGSIEESPATVAVAVTGTGAIIGSATEVRVTTSSARAAATAAAAAAAAPRLSLGRDLKGPSGSRQRRLRRAAAKLASSAARL